MRTQRRQNRTEFKREAKLKATSFGFGCRFIENKSRSFPVPVYETSNDVNFNLHWFGASVLNSFIFHFPANEEQEFIVLNSIQHQPRLSLLRDACLTMNRQKRFRTLSNNLCEHDKFLVGTCTNSNKILNSTEAGVYPNCLTNSGMKNRSTHFIIDPAMHHNVMLLARSSRWFPATATQIVIDFGTRLSDSK